MTYSVSMEATADTYVYHVYGMGDDGTYDHVQLSLADAVKRWPGSVRNNVDALVLVMASAHNLFDELTGPNA